MIYVFDLDGTLADCSHRLHYIGASHTSFVGTEQTQGKDWDAFFAACKDDKPIFEVITVARALAKAGHTIVYSTGRPARTGGNTKEWLSKFRVPDGPLYLRKDGDHREDYIVKEESLSRILEFYGLSSGSGLGGAFEDRQQVVDMLRKRGVRVFQVAPGKF
jgi:hypothetical protein